MTIYGVERVGIAAARLACCAGLRCAAIMLLRHRLKPVRCAARNQAGPRSARRRLGELLFAGAARYARQGLCAPGPA